MDENSRDKEVKIRRGLSLMFSPPRHLEKYSNNEVASHAHGSKLWLAFYISGITHIVPRSFERRRLETKLIISILGFDLN